jgi:phosphoribosylglycinamide formyltransferase-1
VSLPRVAILISGGGSNMVRLVEDMQAGGYAEPVLVASNDPGAGGLAKAAALGVPVAAVDHKPFGKDRAAFEAELLKPLLAAQPDVVCLAGFMRVLTPGFVGHFAGRMLNIHPSLLPKYPGLHTHARALEAGDAEAGCTVHEVTPVLDDGPILGQGRVPVLQGDTPETLAARVLGVEHRLYPAVLKRFVVGELARIDL